jgi:D-alanine-D-alanine ligase
VSARVGELTAVVLAGGLAYEREVSLRSGRRVAEALKQTGVAVRVLDPDGELLAGLDGDRPDAVFVALHGADGEDGALRSVLDLAGVRYVGSDAAACRMAWDKPTAKAVVAAAGLTTPDWVALPHSTFRELGAAVVLDRIVERFGLPLMVKPAQGGSALGARVVRSATELPAAMVSCLSYGDTVLLEPYVEGVEVAVSWRCRRWRSCRRAGCSTTRPGTRQGRRRTTLPPGWRRTSRPGWRRRPSAPTRRSGCATCPGPTRS